MMRLQKMNQSTKLLLGLLNEMQTPVRGRTMMQKIVFILRSRFGKFEEYQYSLHYYGPYSEDLTDDLRHLKYQGLIEESAVEIQDVTRFDIRLTDKGKGVAQRAREAFHGTSLSRMAAEANQLNSSKLKDVIDEAYQMAAKHGLG